LAVLYNLILYRSPNGMRHEAKQGMYKSQFAVNLFLKVDSESKAVGIKTKRSFIVKMISVLLEKSDWECW